MAETDGKYSAEGLASIGRDAFWEAVANACPDIKTGDLEPGADHKFEQESVEVVNAWLLANAPATPERWTIVVEGPADHDRLDVVVLASTARFVPGTTRTRPEVRELTVLEVHRDDMLERG